MAYQHFSQEERCVLSAYLKEGLSFRAIARKLHRSVGAISLEIPKGSIEGTRAQYDPYLAHLGARMTKWQANSRNACKSDKVRSYVEEKLKEDWSPEEIAGRIVLDFPDDLSMRISHETVYQYINDHPDWVKHLRRGKPRRERRRHRLAVAKGTQGLGPVRGIEERPLQVQTRERFGDWESDSMLGTKSGGAILSVQHERKGRYTVLTKAKNKSAVETCKAIRTQLQKLPAEARKTMTFDRGTENAEHERFGIETYFCDPYSSWQKGSVENCIGLIRQYLPKGKSLDTLTTEELQVIQRKLNHRPRKCLGFKTPYEVFSAYLQTLGVQLRD